MSIWDKAKDFFAKTVEDVRKDTENFWDKLEYKLEDTKIAVFGHQGVHPIRDISNYTKGILTIGLDAATGIYNVLSPDKAAPVFSRQENAVSGAAGAVITSNFTTGASIGDLSWLIYKNRLDSNPEMQAKWQLYRDIETTHGFNCRTYVDGTDKQVAITLEGTQANSDLSPFWVSKDGLADLEIGTGVIPPQVREGYEEFKTLVADVVNAFGKDFGISVAGHSLGGGLAQMMAGMYYIDTGVALPTLAEAGPGMLGQLKLYAEQQLMAGAAVHLPGGNVVQLAKDSILTRASEAKAIVSGFKAQDFSFVTNFITQLDPVGAVNYDSDPAKDGHVGVNFIVPYFLTAREDLQDTEFEKLAPLDWKNWVTPELTDKLGFGNISVTRFDRHQPEQSVAVWSGTEVGLVAPTKPNGASGGFLAPKKVWAGSKLGLAEVSMFGTDGADTIVTSDQATQVFAGKGDDVIRSGNGGNMLSGGQGNDMLYGGSGDDFLSGEEGADQLYGNGGNDVLYGGAGDDSLYGGSGDDLLYGGSGNDTLTWDAGNDILFGNEGNDTFAIAAGAAGQAEIKWDRNFTNFGQDIVDIQGAMAADSSLLFNFADEIRFQDMKWSVQGEDILMTDSMGNTPASVDFKNAFTSFAENNGKLAFQFTNGKLYVDDQKYAVSSGQGDVRSKDGSGYAGTILTGSAGADTLYAGSGNDLLFGGAGKDTFVFGSTFGSDQIIGSEGGDAVQFQFDLVQSAYKILQDNKDLVISLTNGANMTDSLRIADWYNGSEQMNKFTFTNGSYQVNGTSFAALANG